MVLCVTLYVRLEVQPSERVLGDTFIKGFCYGDKLKNPMWFE